VSRSKLRLSVAGHRQLVDRLAAHACPSAFVGGLGTEPVALSHGVGLAELTSRSFREACGLAPVAQGIAGVGMGSMRVELLIVDNLLAPACSHLPEGASHNCNFGWVVADTGKFEPYAPHSRPAAWTVGVLIVGVVLHRAEAATGLEQIPLGGKAVDSR